MNLINNALSQGFTAANVIQYLSRHFPHARKKIEKAVAEGFSESDIIKFLSGGRKGVNAPVTEHEKTRQSDKDKQANLEKNLVKGGLALGATALGGYALSRALPRAGQSLTGQLLPALPQGPLQMGTQVRPQLPPTGQAAIQPPPPAPKGPLPYTNPSAQNRPIRPSPTQPAPQASPAIQTPSLQPQQTLTLTPSTPPKIFPLPEALQKQASAMLQAGNDIDKIESALKSIQPHVVKEYEKATNAPIRAALEDFAKQANLPMQQPTTPRGIRQAAQETSNAMEQPSGNEIPEPIRTITPKTEGGIPKLIEEGRKKYEEQMGKGATVALPSGEIGEISDIRQGIATVNAGGKEYRRKVDELEQEPEGLEEYARKLVDLIPEGEKSTAFQESIHLNLPTPEGEGIMVTKYYGGKWAWYMGVSNEDYSRIAEGTFEPKGEARTGIAEYKPGVIDSRGAGNQQLIIQNPKYSKANRGKTWDYADTKYSALKSIDPLLQKMSRERKDEEGNVIQKREKPARESAPSAGLSKPQNEKAQEKVEKKNEPEKSKSTTRLREISKEAADIKKNEYDKKFKKMAEFSKELKKIDEPTKKFGNPEITPKKLKEQKKYILSKLEEAISNPTEKDYINIDVPGDGHFRIVNLKESLEKFQKRVEKKWPTAPLKSNMPQPHKR